MWVNNLLIVPFDPYSRILTVRIELVVFRRVRKQRFNNEKLLFFTIQHFAGRRLSAGVVAF